MNIMMKEMPGRVFDVGIAEAHAVTFSAGLAKEGMLPFCNIYSSFAQRAYDQIIHDAALQKLDMVICLDRAGLVGEDGPTHHGMFDLAYLRCVPNLTVASPINEHALRNLMYTASRPGAGTFVIRYPRGRGELAEWRNPMEILPPGKGRKLKDGERIAVLGIGPIGYAVREAIDLAEKTNGSTVAHYDMIYLKPIDEDLLHEAARKYDVIITVENGVVMGGLGSAVLEFLADKGYRNTVKRVGIQDRFIEHGSIPELHKICELDAESIKNVILSL
jgi:1-deoxy-D-xylulose-5-phosphate synthase